MQDAINVIAISAKGKSRIGSKLVTAIVEQIHEHEIFIVIHNRDTKEVSQCRWIKRQNDPDYRIIESD